FRGSRRDFGARGSGGRRRHDCGWSSVRRDLTDRIVVEMNHCKLFLVSNLADRPGSRTGR
ncbi:MAG: hypothetical protein AAFU79_06475, partial [Myxococcota bacterium]